MKLSLARWEHNGSSRGWWMVRELPGVAILLVDTGWGQAWDVYSSPELLNDYCHVDEPDNNAWRTASRLWGEGFAFTDLSGLPCRRFPSRFAALAALESLASQPSVSQLPELL